MNIAFRLYCRKDTIRGGERVASDCNPGEPGMFHPILHVLLEGGDRYMHLADLRSDGEAHARVGQFYFNPAPWDRAAILNVANAVHFSSDRTIAQYGQEIWQVSPCPVEAQTAATQSAF